MFILEKLFSTGKKFNIDKIRIKELEDFQRTINFFIKDIQLLNIALTHISFVKSNNLPITACNERLEFLGDSVIGFIISEYLYLNFLDFREGTLSKIKGDIVSRKYMYEIGEKIGISKYVLCYPSIDKYEEQGRKNIISNALESIVGAFLISNGFDYTKNLVLTLFRDKITERIEKGSRDSKSLLQNISLKLYKTYPSYRVLEEIGPHHNRVYLVEVSLGDKKALGNGQTKKEAEQQAASKLLEIISYNQEIPYGK